MIVYSLGRTYCLAHAFRNRIIIDTTCQLPLHKSNYGSTSYCIRTSTTALDISTAA